MTSIPNNNTGDWLDEILRLVVIGNGGIAIQRAHEIGLSRKEAKAAILAKLNEIIGEDEQWVPDYYEHGPDEVIRNELRAEQRKRAGIKVEEK